MSYLYDEMDASARAVFGAHLVTCEVCRDELRALGGVRRQLAHWAPPQPTLAFSESAIRNPQPAIGNGWWREIPVWAQVAAALLVLVSARGSRI